jgi:hypothetical protein
LDEDIRGKEKWKNQAASSKFSDFWMPDPNQVEGKLDPSPRNTALYRSSETGSRLSGRDGLAKGSSLPLAFYGVFINTSDDAFSKKASAAFTKSG